VLCTHFGVLTEGIGASMSRGRSLKLACLGAGLALLAGCAAKSDDGATSGDEEDLTSLTARQRTLTFEGVVYVDPKTSESEILDVAKVQTQTAFGALLAQNVAVRTREVQNIDKSSLVKREVLVVDPNVASDKGKSMIEVRYKYGDDAVIPVELSHHTTLSLALLAQGAEHETKLVIPDCTKNDKEAREDAAIGLLWYDFNPSMASCRKAIDREQKTIDADTAKLTDKKKMVAKSRTTRLYLPTAMTLLRADTATKATYPEYDKLFGGGGVDPNALTLGLVVGRLAHEHVEAVKDDGYFEWHDTLGVIFEAHPDFVLTKTEPAEDLTTATVNGKKITGLTFKNFVEWTVFGTGFPAGLNAAEKKEITQKIANKLDNHWVTFEKKVKVAINDGSAKDYTIRINTLFGADEDPEPHRHAVKNNDVVIYNGHSYIGQGPLDPDNFRSTSFAPGYQIFFFDSCVSYNYYEKDFFTLKPGGSKVLDIITNGIEAPESESGAAEGRLIAKLIDGSLPSYQTLLEAAKATDSLRVVDGEIDNKYHPTKVSIRVTKP
jgi:hypothetical protein